jgi:hypothetical protein
MADLLDFSVIVNIESNSHYRENIGVFIHPTFFEKEYICPR